MGHAAARTLTLVAAHLAGETQTADHLLAHGLLHVLRVPLTTAHHWAPVRVASVAALLLLTQQPTSVERASPVSRCVPLSNVAGERMVCAFCRFLLGQGGSGSG